VFERDISRAFGDLLKVNGNYIIAFHRRHISELPGLNQLDRFRSQPGRKNPVGRRGGAASLQMPQYNLTCLYTGCLFYLVPQYKTYPAQTDLLRAILYDFLHHDLAASRLGSFRNNHDAESFAYFVPLSDFACHRFNIIGNFGDKNYIAARRNPCI
jgi:hypothetical protein